MKCLRCCTSLRCIIVHSSMWNSIDRIIRFDTQRLNMTSASSAWTEPMERMGLTQVRYGLIRKSDDGSDPNETFQSQAFL